MDTTAIPVLLAIFSWFHGQTGGHCLREIHRKYLYSTMPDQIRHYALVKDSMIKSQRLNAANKQSSHLNDILCYVRPVN